ncbi:MAG: hypothetical protein P8J32_08295 [bacterium]|nr:hypothetical protein [bacterium]
MAAIPGSVRVTGILAPTDSADTYPVTDAQYGLDGLRNFTGDTSSLTNITAQRRRAGMIAGIVSGSTRFYYRLNDEPWAYDQSDWTKLTLYDYTGDTAFTQVESQYWISGGTGTGLYNVNSGHNVLGEYSLAGGGFGNTVYGNYSIAVGGLRNVVSATTSFISSAAIAGSDNIIEDGIIIGGIFNTAHTGSLTSVIAGGTSNRISALTSFIGGGNLNRAEGIQSAVVGGSQNKAYAANSASIGGVSNSAVTSNSVTIGGSNNTTKGAYTVTIGGQNSVANGLHSVTIGAGLQSSGYSQTVLGVKNIPQGNPSTEIATDYVVIVGGGEVASGLQRNALAITKEGMIQMQPFTASTLPNTNVSEGALAFSASTGLYQYVGGVWTGFTSGSGGAGALGTWQESITQGNIVTTGNPTLSGESITFRPTTGTTFFREHSLSNGLFQVTGSTGYGFELNSEYLQFINDNDSSFTQIGNQSGGNSQIVSNNGPYTTTFELTHSVTSNQTWTMPDKSGTVALLSDLSGNTLGAPQTLNCIATTLWNLDFGHNAKITLTADTTFNITNVLAGDYGTVVVTQDGIGGHSITPPASSKVVNGAGGLLNLTSNAAAIDILTFYYDGSIYYWNLGGDYT